MAEKNIPEKLYYSIGEVKEITSLEPHVLRFWETEFPALKPRKNGRGQRTYQKKDIDMILRIKELLYEKKYTIKGAISALKEKKKKQLKEDAPLDDNREFLLKMRHELKLLMKTLDGSKSDDLFSD